MDIKEPDNIISVVDGVLELSTLPGDVRTAGMVVTGIKVLCTRPSHAVSERK